MKTTLYKICFVLGTLIVVFASMLMLAALGALKGSFLGDPLFMSMLFFVMGMFLSIAGVFFMLYGIKFKTD